MLLEIRHVHLHRMEFCPQQWGHGGPQEPAGLDMALADGGRFPRVFGDKFGEEFCDKFGDEFSESPNLVMN